ncbi:MAG: D-alanine--D-alanine ligase [Syntrophorhabdales bacterium]|jgi:D-alanine-D-alanine ligase
MMTREDLRQKKIAVLMGGLSSEREISLASGQAVLAGLVRSGYSAFGIDVGRNLADRLQGERIDVAFVALHGRWGEDGTVQGLLEMMAIPYTGSGVLGSALAMDKALSKMLLVGRGIPTPAYRTYRSGDETDFPIPFVVKPAREGSTVGISIVRQEEEIDEAIRTAFQYDNKVLVEDYVSGREITVGVVNGLCLPIVEVRPKSGFYDFTSKYTKGMTEYLVPAELGGDIAERARDEALAVWRHFELAGCARVDMIVDNDIPLVIDINTSPGMTETSLVPKAWGQLGRTFDHLVEEILRGADLKA